MLVLTRKVGEQILIGDEITVTVLDVRKDGIKIGIDAPRHIRVQRQEIVLAVADENLESAKSSSSAEAALKSLFGIAPAEKSQTESGSGEDEVNPPENGAE